MNVSETISSAWTIVELFKMQLSKSKNDGHDGEKSNEPRMRYGESLSKSRANDGFVQYTARQLCTIRMLCNATDTVDKVGKNSESKFKQTSQSRRKAPRDKGTRQ